jgi:hypothetical protein
MYIDLHVKYPLVLSDFNEILTLYRNIFEKYSNIRFHENTSIGGRVVPNRWTDGRLDEQTSRNSGLKIKSLTVVLTQTYFLFS